MIEDDLGYQFDVEQARKKYFEWMNRNMANMNAPVKPPLMVPYDEAIAERAAHAIHGAVADFIVAITEAKTIAEAHRLYEMLGPLVSVLESTERKALKRTEELNP